MRKVAVFNGTRPMRHFECDAVMAAIEANVAARSATRLAVGELDLMARYRAEVQQRIAATFDRIVPAEVHRP